jgi:sugar lactone lactonase YvrE
MGYLVAGVYATAGTGPTQLYFPRAIYFDSSTASLVIANYGAQNIVRWVLGATSWTLVAGITGFSGSSSTQLNSPGGVTVDNMGNVYVADTGNHRIQLFIAGQSNGLTIAGAAGISGTNSSLLNSPSSVAFDSQNNLYVADTNNHRIQKFSHY